MKNRKSRRKSPFSAPENRRHMWASCKFYRRGTRAYILTVQSQGIEGFVVKVRVTVSLYKSRARFIRRWKSILDKETIWKGMGTRNMIRLSQKSSFSLFGPCKTNKQQMLGKMMVKDTQTTAFPRWWTEAMTKLFLEYSHEKEL